MMKSIIVLLVCIIYSLHACHKKEVNPDCHGSYPAYQTEIKTILDQSCVSCHHSGSKNFATYQGLKPYLDNGRFKKVVIDDQTMPKFKKLSQEELDKIQCWIKGGYLEK